MYACASCDLLLLSSKLNLFACSLKMDLGPLTMFPLLTGVIALSVESTAETLQEEKCLLPCSPDVFSASANCSTGGFFRFSACRARCSLSAQLLQHGWLFQHLIPDVPTDSPVHSPYNLLLHLPQVVLHQSDSSETLSCEQPSLASERVDFRKIPLATFLPSSVSAVAAPSPTSYRSELWGPLPWFFSLSHRGRNILYYILLYVLYYIVSYITACYSICHSYCLQSSLYFLLANTSLLQSPLKLMVFILNFPR